MIFKRNKELQLFKPIEGGIIAIEDVSDITFSNKLIGDGIAIQPLDGCVLSPLKGEIIMLQDSLHAIGIKNEDGIEVLIHIGIDTVQLHGEGFKKHINVNDLVDVGIPLITFDKDLVEGKGYSAILMMIVVDNPIIKSITKYKKNPLLTVTYKL